MDDVLKRVAPWIFAIVGATIGSLAILLLMPESAAGTQSNGMVWIPTGQFDLGSPTEEFPDARPIKRVALDGFWLERTEVTNAQFKQFVEATGYVTDAEKAQAAPDPAQPGLPPVPSCSHHQTPRKPVSTIIGAGGDLWKEPNGGIRLAQIPRSKARMIIRSFRSAGTMLKPTAAGPANACPPRPSGNMPCGQVNPRKIRLGKRAETGR